MSRFHDGKALARKIVVAALLTACGVPQAEFDTLQARNAELETELAELRARETDREATAAPSRVTLAGTETRVLQSAFNEQRYLIKVKLPRAEVLENETHRTLFGAAFTNGLRYLFAPGA